MYARSVPAVIDISFITSVIWETGIPIGRKRGQLSILLQRLVLHPDKMRETGGNARVLADNNFTCKRVVQDNEYILKSNRWQTNHN